MVVAALPRPKSSSTPLRAKPLNRSVVAVSASTGRADLAGQLGERAGLDHHTRFGATCAAAGWRALTPANR